jgi:ArsR family transcriptional regulator
MADTCSCSLVHEEAVGMARAAAPSAETVEALGGLFKVFGDPSRVRILSALAAAELCVCDLGLVLGMSQSAISHQLALLRAARLVRNRREGKVIYYSLDDDHVRRLLALGLEHVAEEGRTR